MAKQEIETLILAGTKLSNFAFNVAREEGRIPARWLNSARDAVSEFDNALKAYRGAAERPKKMVKIRAIKAKGRKR
jgi:hypothetical protein